MSTKAKLTLLLERCQSGRMGLTANELTRETGSEGSNPSLSASHQPKIFCAAPRCVRLVLEFYRFSLGSFLWRMGSGSAEDRWRILWEFCKSWAAGRRSCLPESEDSAAFVYRGAMLVEILPSEDGKSWIRRAISAFCIRSKAPRTNVSGSDNF